MAPSNSNDLARRIARGEARTYWEQNLVDGRRAAIHRLVDWMQPLAGRRVLAAAGSEGHLARRLASSGAEVVGCSAGGDAVTGARLAASEVDLGSASPADVLTGDRHFDDVVLWELLERLDEADAGHLFAALETAAPQRLYVALRLQPRWSRWLASYPGDELPTADPVRILRSLHLATDYRLHRHHTITRRNSALRVLELLPARVPGEAV